MPQDIPDPTLPCNVAEKTVLHKQQLGRTPIRIQTGPKRCQQRSYYVCVNGIVGQELTVHELPLGTGAQLQLLLKKKLLDAADAEHTLRDYPLRSAISMN
jgi:hypothetical protein